MTVKRQVTIEFNTPEEVQLLCDIAELARSEISRNGAIVYGDGREKKLRTFISDIVSVARYGQIEL